MKNVPILFWTMGLLLPQGVLAQDTEKKPASKQESKGGEAKGGEKKTVDPEGAGKKGHLEGELALPVKEVDTNGDYMISMSELIAALAKLTGTSLEKKGGKSDGGDKKAPLKEGAEKEPGKKTPLKEGEGEKKAAPKDGETEKKPPAKEGGDKAGEKKLPPKEGSEKDGAKKAPPKDGEGEK